MTRTSHPRDARFAAAIARIDAANAEDPSFDIVDGARRPKALVYSDRMVAMLARFVPDASETLALAARCQHIERWKIPRSEYPLTRAGYQEWRARLRDFHADRAAAMLREAGYEEATIARVRALIRKERIKSDPEAQALEDVVALVFLESYLAEFVATHGEYDEAKLIDILHKTGRKMSARGRAAALSDIALSPAIEPVIRRALAALPTDPA
jgi:hypothetical protein